MLGPTPDSSVPEALVASTLRREGEPGRRWLDDLPALIGRFVGEWGCAVVGQACHGEVAIVLPVRRSGRDAVLKLSFPHSGFTGEVNALRHFDGRGAVRLLEADEESGAALLERAGPRTLASTSSVNETIEIMGELAYRLAVPAPARAPSLAGAAHAWAEDLERQRRAEVGSELPFAALARAQETIEILGTDGTSTMMHGDLHVGNVLAAVREPWLTIDPLGWRGTAAFDAFTVIAGRRADQPAAAEPDAMRARIRRYARAAAVDVTLAEACCQARATSTYLYQRMTRGDWFDLGFLRTASTLGIDRRRSDS